jgi:type II secretory pathway component PulJ
MRFWRELLIAVLSIIAAGFFARIVSEPFRVDANTSRLERLERIADQHLERLLQLEIRHEPQPRQHGHTTPEN